MYTFNNKKLGHHN